MRDELLLPEEAAELLRIPLSTLRIWRHRREGPAVVKVGRLLRYSRQDLERWVDSRREGAARGA